MNRSADEHRQLRELLGAYALGGLDDATAAPVRAHLDGCPACRAELAEIAPLAAELRRVDPAHLTGAPSPPADLGDRIRAQVADERVLADARRARAASSASRRRALVATAAVALVVAAVGVGSVLGRVTAPSVTAAPSAAAAAKSTETVPVQAAAGVRVDGGAALVVAHTWGVEARIVATGFAAGQVYRASFRSADGRLLPAGEFLGTGDKALTCNLQSALLRADTTGFAVTDAAGQVVLSADLPRS